MGVLGAAVVACCKKTVLKLYLVYKGHNETLRYNETLVWNASGGSWTCNLPNSNGLSNHLNYTTLLPPNELHFGFFSSLLSSSANALTRHLRQ